MSKPNYKQKEMKKEQHTIKTKQSHTRGQVVPSIKTQETKDPSRWQHGRFESTKSTIDITYLIKRAHKKPECQHQPQNQGKHSICYKYW